MQQYVDQADESEQSAQEASAPNIFEQDRIRKEAIRRKREELKAKKQSMVVPQVITYPVDAGSFGSGAGSGSGMYRGTIGSAFMLR